MKSFSFLTAEKINITKINIGARTKLERYKIECEDYARNVGKTVKSTNSWFSTVQIKPKNQEKRKHFVVQHSKNRKDNESSEKKKNSNIRSIELFCKKKW